MKIIIYLVAIIIAIFLLTGGVKIQFSPFKITFGNIFFPIGYVLIILGLIACIVGSYLDGYKDGIKKAIKEETTEIKYL